MYVCLYVYVFETIYVHMNVCMYVRIYLYMGVCLCVCVYACMLTNLHVLASVWQKLRFERRSFLL